MHRQVVSFSKLPKLPNVYVVGVNTQGRRKISNERRRVFRMNKINMRVDTTAGVWVSCIV